MYIPLFKQTSEKYTDGKSFIEQETGKPYKGFYIETSSGEIYSGRVYSRGVSKKLIRSITNTGANTPIPEEYDFIKRDTTALNLKTTLPVPTHIPTKRYEDKYIYRYFAQRKADRSIIEISNEVFLELKSESTVYHYPSYSILQMVWYVGSPIEDRTISGVLQKGSLTKNREEITKAEKILPGISQLLDPMMLLL